MLPPFVMSLNLYARKRLQAKVHLGGTLQKLVPTGCGTYYWEFLRRKANSLENNHPEEAPRPCSRGSRSEDCSSNNHLLFPKSTSKRDLLVRSKPSLQLAAKRGFYQQFLGAQMVLCFCRMG